MLGRRLHWEKQAWVPGNGGGPRRSSPPVSEPPAPPSRPSRQLCSLPSLSHCLFLQEQCLRNVKDQAVARQALLSYHPFWLCAAVEVVLAKAPTHPGLGSPGVGFDPGGGWGGGSPGVRASLGRACGEGGCLLHRVEGDGVPARFPGGAGARCIEAAWRRGRARLRLGHPQARATLGTGRARRPWSSLSASSCWVIPAWSSSRAGGHSPAPSPRTGCVRACDLGKGASRTSGGLCAMWQPGMGSRPLLGQPRTTPTHECARASSPLLSPFP